MKAVVCRMLKSTGKELCETERSFVILFIYTTFIKRSIHKQTCSNALFNKNIYSCNSKVSCIPSFSEFLQKFMFSYKATIIESDNSLMNGIIKSTFFFFRSV